MTYAALAEEMDRVGNVLRSLDVRPEERVAIVLHDSPELVATFFGAIKIGAVPVPLATGLTPADYRFRLADSGAAIVLVHESLASLLPEARSLRRLRHTIVVGTPIVWTLWRRGLTELVWFAGGTVVLLLGLFAVRTIH